MTVVEPNVKGSTLRARDIYARNRGKQEYARFLSEVPPATLQVIEGGLLPSSWYPYSAFVDMCVVLDRLYGEGDLELCYDLGRFACDVNLKTVHRIFFKVGNIGFIIKRAAAAWRANYDAGSMRVLERAKRSVRIEIVDWPQPHRAHCLSVKGWTVRAGELSGETMRRGPELCRALGDERCEMSFEW